MKFVNWVNRNAEYAGNLEFENRDHRISLFILQDENLIRELQNQYEGLEAHLDYIQENITESQGTIMGLEVSDDLAMDHFNNDIEVNL